MRRRSPDHAPLRVPRLAHRVLVLATLTAAGSGCFSTAHAQESVCSGPYTHTRWLEGLDTVDAHLAAFDVESAHASLREIQDQLRCLDAIAKPSHVARFARLMALVSFFDQDSDSTRRWGLLSRYADSSLPWSADFPEDHPFRKQVEDAADPPIGGPREGLGLAVPKRGGVFMNGHFLARPEAHAEVPVLVQIADKKGRLLDTFWQDGAAFPEPLLVETNADARTPPSWWTGPDEGNAGLDASETLFAETSPETPPPEASPSESESPPLSIDTTTPLETPRRGVKVSVTNLAVSGGLGLTAGVFWALSSSANERFRNKATTESELISTRTQANLFALSAGLTGAAAIGLGVTAFVSADGPSVGIALRY